MDPFMGEIRMFGGNFAPRSWAFCNGQLLAISQNSALFSLLGTIYGGDGRTTFALPDLRGRVAISPGQGPGLPNFSQGNQGGATTTTLTANQLPSHTHAVAVNVSTESAEESTAGHLASSAIYNEDATAGATLKGVTIGNTGNNQSFNNMQPYLAVNYIIALQGIYPSRS